MRKQRVAKCHKTFDVRSWAQSIWQALDTPVSLACYLAKDPELVERSVVPRNYTNASNFFRDYQAVKLLSKYPFLKTGIDTRKRALEKFAEAEDQCRITNERFFGWRRGLKELTPSERVGRVLFYAQQKIADILGEVPQLSDLDFKFGPGASFGTRGDTSAYKKMAHSPECTIAFTRILNSFRKEFPAWSLSDEAPTINIVAGSELTVVPKDAKTDRPICIEPLYNGLYQKGVGSYIRDRLQKFGVCLRDQAINQRLASIAHSHNLSTVDFASASDTISYGLVLELLPIDWVEFLDVARSPFYKIDGEWKEFHKFSSMGNAYTFELESMIFYALSASVCRELNIPYQTGTNLHVYGDDVIIPREAFDLFAEVSQYCGFTINLEKSFKEGLFFESCGTDWFNGTPVRPMLLKTKILSLQELFYVANTTLEILFRAVASGCPNTVLDNLRQVHASVVAVIPRRQRFLVPYRTGSGIDRETRGNLGFSPDFSLGLWSDFDVAHPVRHGNWCGYLFRGAVSVPTKVKKPTWSYHYALYCALSCGSDWWNAPSEDLKPSEGYSHRQSPRHLKVKTLFWHGDWPLLPYQWNERALGLVR